MCRMYFLVLLAVSVITPSCTNSVIRGEEHWLEHPQPPHVYATNMWWRYANYTAKTVSKDKNCYVCTFLHRSVNHVPGIVVPEDSMEQLNCIIPMVSRADEYPLGNGSVSCGGHTLLVHPHVFARVTVVSSIPSDLRCVERMSSEPNVVSLGLIPQQHCQTIFKHCTKTQHECFSKCLSELPFWLGSSGSLPHFYNNHAEKCREKCDYPLLCNNNAPGKQGTIVVENWHWLCGFVVYTALPKNWVGRCALVKLHGYSMVIKSQNPNNESNRKKRSVSLNEFHSISSYAQLPTEFKLWSATGMFFSILAPQYGVVTAMIELEIVRYNVLAFINSTQNSLNSIKEELRALRLTSVQNRLVLDQLTAAQGGVCAIIGETCCTYIPDNDADGNVIDQAIKNMSRVYSDMKSRSSAEYNWDWDFLGLNKFFGNFTHTAYSVLVCLIVFVLCLLSFPVILWLARLLIRRTCNALAHSKSQVQV